MNGSLAINSFAISRLKALQLFYKNIIDKLEKDHLAFVREQLSWLELKQDKVDEIIKGTEFKYREELRVVIEELVGKNIVTKENTKFKVDNREAIFIHISQMREKFQLYRNWIAW